jgi:hypothetical protein
MIYVGDGPRDIPCLSTVLKLGGKGIGVYRQGSALKEYQLARGGRLAVGPYKAENQSGSDIRNMLEEMIQEIGLAVHRRFRERLVNPPSHWTVEHRKYRS